MLYEGGGREGGREREGGRKGEGGREGGTHVVGCNCKSVVQCVG